MNNPYVFLCNSYPNEYDEYFNKLSGCDTSVSGVIFGNSIIDGLRKKNLDSLIISGVSIGHYPLSTKTRRVPHIKFGHDYYCVGFNNFVGINQISKANAIYKCHKKNWRHANNDDEMNILIVDIHLPYINAALRIKKRFKNAKIVQICLDIPENIKSSKETPVRSFLKRISMKMTNSKLGKVDGFVLLSEEMKDKLPVNSKPYIVFPCIADSSLYRNLVKEKQETVNIVYAGVLSKQYNLDFLLETFSMIRDANYRLLLAGKGDALDDIREFSRKDPRVIYLGELSRREALKAQLNAAVLVNPRLPEEKYTSYSFPSKTISYLLTGNPVVCYSFSSFPDDVRDAIVEPEEKTPESFAACIKKAVALPQKEEFSFLDKYSSESFIDKIESLFNDIRGPDNG